LPAFPAQENVRYGIEVWRDREILVDSLDPVGSRFMRGREPHLFPCEDDLTAFQR
jgi:hypothetical protein